MGTRNVTMVIKDGQTKIAQYGQWDGYPRGVGSSVLAFISNDELKNKLIANLSKCRFIEPEGRDKDFNEAYEKNAPEWSSDPDNRTPEQKRWFKTYMTRDLAADILENVALSEDEEIILGNSTDFMADSLMNEWSYVIDFDKNVFEVYKGFNKTPLTEADRFFGLKEKGDYEPVKIAASWPLDALPTESEFMDYFSNKDEDE